MRKVTHTSPHFWHPNRCLVSGAFSLCVFPSTLTSGFLPIALPQLGFLSVLPPWAVIPSPGLYLSPAGCLLPSPSLSGCLSLEFMVPHGASSPLFCCHVSRPRPERIFFFSSSTGLLKPEAQESFSPNLASSSALSGLFILSPPCCPHPSLLSSPPRLSSRLDFCKEPLPQVPLPARFRPRLYISSGKPHEPSPHILFLTQWALSNCQDRFCVLEQHRTHWKLFLASDNLDAEEERTAQVLSPVTRGKVG